MWQADELAVDVAAGADVDQPDPGELGLVQHVAADGGHRHGSHGHLVGRAVVEVGQEHLQQDRITNREVDISKLRLSPNCFKETRETVSATSKKNYRKKRKPFLPNFNNK